MAAHSSAAKTRGRDALASSYIQVGYSQLLTLYVLNFSEGT